MTFLEQFVATTTRSRHTGTTFPLFPLLASDKGRFSSHDNPPLYATGTYIVRCPLRSFPSYALPATLTVDSGHVIVKRLSWRHFLPSCNLVLDTVDRSVRSSNRRLRVSRRNRNGGELADKCPCHRQPSLHLRPVQGYLRRAFRFVEGIFFPSSRSLGNWTMRVDKRRDGSANLYRPLSRDDRCRDIHRGNGTLYRRLYALPASSFFLRTRLLRESPTDNVIEDVRVGIKRNLSRRRSQRFAEGTVIGTSYGPDTRPI